jgi:transaldolase/glucose-6-phosphate isomerase
VRFRYDDHAGGVDAMDARDRLIEMRAVERLAAGDATLFADLGIAAHRLAWIGLPGRALEEAPRLAALAAELTAGITDVVVLGMGGSSLAALVLSRSVSAAPGSPALHVLDTTSPGQTTTLLDRLEPASTLVVVASKSGSTAEPLAQLEIFGPWLAAALGDDASSHLIAITDPGSSLEMLARGRGFAAVVLSDPDVGGRFSALTPFGMLPAALAGIDVALLASTAAGFEASCMVSSDRNPALALAAWMGDACAEGRDKLTLVCSPALASFGLWVEQLVAESTGKQGVGILPVIEDPPGLAAAHGPDRMTFVLREEDDAALARVHGLLPEGEPVFEVVVDDPAALAAEFVHWEWAVALFSALQGIEPFGQPDVESAKAVTRGLLSGDGAPCSLSALSSPKLTGTGDLPARVRALVHGARADGYIAVLAYLPEDEALLAPLRAACAHLSEALLIPVTLQLGPRYLHSTGQYFKGGPGTGSFLIVGAEHCEALEGPLRSLARLNAAQAAGDATALLFVGRPVLAVSIAAETADALSPLLDALARAASG